MTVIKKELLDKILADLNMTNNQVVSEGFFDGLAKGARKVANWAGNTNIPATQKGLVFLKPDGKTFVSIQGVVPNSQTANYLTREYTAAKYLIPTPEQVSTMNASNTEVHTPQEMVGNLKDSTEAALQQLTKMAGDMETQIAGKTTLTSQESAQYYNKLVNFIITSIKQTQANMPSFPGAQPVPQVQQAQAVNQLPAALPVNINPQPATATPQGSAQGAIPGLGRQDYNGIEGGPRTAEVYAGQMPQPQVQGIPPSIRANVPVNHPLAFQANKTIQ